MKSEAGFTLVEVMLAAALITLGLAGLLAAVPVATFAVHEGHQMSTATFLANQRLEQARNMPWSTAPDNDCLGISASASAAPTVPAGKTCSFNGVTINAGGALPWFADQNAAAIAGFPGFTRTVRVTDCGAGAGCGGIVNSALRYVTVTTTYRPMTAVSGPSAVATKPVVVNLLVSQR